MRHCEAYQGRGNLPEIASLCSPRHRLFAMSNDYYPPLLEQSFTRLPDIMYSRVKPVPVDHPVAFLLNDKLADELSIDRDWLLSEEAVQVLSGNQQLGETEAIATAYTGHQFGHPNPRLGDGRAHLLGDLLTATGERVDVQLKGSGVTPYSRQGDGRSALGPVIREYIVSEAMAALGVPTTRALAAIFSGENVWRDKGAEPGGILTRVAASHVRVGSFEYAAAGGKDCVKALADFVVQRHFNDLPDENIAYMNLLREVIKRQAKLIAQWQSFGFIHGVMNTDNMLVSGQTIDYGPCAFLDTYEPDKVFSFIDRQGRYRFSNQGPIGQWNLVRLAEALLLIMGDDRAAAVDTAQAALNDYQPLYENAYAEFMGHKIGLQSGHAVLVNELMDIMEKDSLDYTLSFRYLMQQLDSKHIYYPLAAYQPSAELLLWQNRWLEALGDDQAGALAMMQTVNPVFIPRNHLVEEAIQAANKGDTGPALTLVAATNSPFNYDAKWQRLALPPESHQVVKNTFCGT